MNIDIETGNTHPDKNKKSWLPTLWQRFTVRLVFVLSLTLFFAAVSVDASRHPASAASMEATTLGVSGRLAASSGAHLSQPSAVSAGPLDELEGSSYLEFDSQTSHRLRYSKMMGAKLTRSHLTHSHLFTERAQ